MNSLTVADKQMQFVRSDGGREAAGFKGYAGDCVARSIAIASHLPYRQVYDALADGNANQRRSKHSRKPKRSAREGIDTNRKWFKNYMRSLGFSWVPTMFIGSGCQVHLMPGELPSGRLVVSLSKHTAAVIDGVIYDITHPGRETYITRQNDGKPIKKKEWINASSGDICQICYRCVYGYWILQDQ